mmetsp:Transcript_23789/g.35640  ORF Transcript_23789/g.35640 Transcript_23789/m.35640 type:complete len:82 (-) Transcript_23789:39-284(-)|eukprot:CAMPEP_0195016686 /NCGR_PEP_ID=MMETSP0326_2-20130528/25193_1 /TAXON_ID=2866 ORGANISM="Crypthecodinium cohnii, Strain Seligo" /NCGR_SAMPLE_ID=MMETSP0326_2 /ASSEMBLY_ACC=CAM_ASM_000348 /LENGTH=81 /DNA_ID=CAMNT_0040032541 /DNA_START=45 /DNA_END=290 /DNA_ORIENTATION=+
MDNIDNADNTDEHDLHHPAIRGATTTTQKSRADVREGLGTCGIVNLEGQPHKQTSMKGSQASVHSDAAKPLCPLTEASPKA